MTPTRLIRFAIGTFAMAGASLGFALNTDADSSSVVVSFENTKQFTDIDSYARNASKAESRVLDEISREFKKGASKYLPNGYTLDIVVRDIDLAGDRSPLTSTYGDVRVMTAVFPPRIEFAYRVIAPDERVVLEGDTSLRDMNYQDTLRVRARNSGLAAPFISELIDDWSSRDLRRALAKQ